MGYHDVDTAISHSQFLKYAEDLAAVYSLERKRNAELQQAHEGFSDIVHVLDEGGFIADASLVVRAINKRACSLLHLDCSQPIGKPLHTVLREAGALQHTFPTPPSRSLQEGQEQTLHLSSGRVLRMTCSLMKNGWLFCMIRDATEELRLENIKQDFFALLSHELRTPLTGILGFTELLLTQERPPQGLEAEAIKNIHDSGQRMYRIVDELLRFATLQSERRDMEREPLQLPLLVSSVVSRLESMATRKEISVFITYDKDNPVIIRGNAAMIGDMLQHVVQNGIQFGTTGGNVAIRIHPPESGMVRITIEDDGIGIPQSQLSKVFESFYQVEDTLGRRTSGLGLGLSIARIVARIHGGSIALDSDEGKGTTCTITLPATSRRMNKISQGGRA